MPAKNTPARVHVTTDRLFAHVFVGDLEICFENDGAKLEPRAFAATAAHDHSTLDEVAPADVPAQVKEAAAAALAAKLARIIEVTKPRKLTFAQVQRIYGRAVD